MQKLYQKVSAESISHIKTFALTRYLQDKELPITERFNYPQFTVENCHESSFILRYRRQDIFAHLAQQIKLYFPNYLVVSGTARAILRAVNQPTYQLTAEQLTEEFEFYQIETDEDIDTYTFTVLRFSAPTYYSWWKCLTTGCSPTGKYVHCTVSSFKLMIDE